MRPPRPCNSILDECHSIFGNKDREARAVEAHPSCWNKTLTLFRCDVIIQVMCVNQSHLVRGLWRGSRSRTASYELCSSVFLIDVRMRSHTCTESIAARPGNSNRRTVLFCAFDSNTRPDFGCADVNNRGLLYTNIVGSCSLGGSERARASLLSRERLSHLHDGQRKSGRGVWKS